MAKRKSTRQEKDLARIKGNFDRMLDVYKSDHSLVAVSRIRKALESRYP